MPTRSIHVQRIEGETHTRAEDVVAVEDPLEIRLSQLQAGEQTEAPISITMRTPGHDAELAVGFLFSEGVISSKEDVIGTTAAAEAEGSVIRVRLRASVTPDVNRLERNFYMTSSCGVCGKASLEAVRTSSLYTLAPGRPQVASGLFGQLEHVMTGQQKTFSSTGGLHASALFQPDGTLVEVFEDVGRHNALDKLIGSQVMQGLVPLADRILMVSGRVSFELVQKAAMAGVPILAAVGAPSSLAVELAEDSGMTLVGFVRENRYNIYSCPDRILT